MAQLLLLLLLLVCLCSSIANCMLCSSSSACNGVPVRYPFSMQPSCGARSFHLDCDPSGSLPLWSYPDGGDASFPVRNITLNRATNGSVIVQPDNTMSPNCSTRLAANFSNVIRNFYFLSKDVNINTPYVILAFSCDADAGPGAGVGANASSLPPGLQRGGRFCSAFLKTCGDDAPSPQTCFEAGTMNGIITLVLRNSNCRHYTAYHNTSLPDPLLLGVELKWNISSDPASSCERCEHSNGTCGYNDTINFLCYCSANISSLYPYCPPIIPTNIDGGGNAMHKSKANSNLVIVASSLGTTVLVFLVIGVTIMCIVPRFHQCKAVVAASQTDVYSSYCSDSVSKKELVQALAERVGPIPTKLYSYGELLEATESFCDARLLGDGGFGAVYEGRLPGGSRVAVKRFYHDNYRCSGQFVNEIRLLSGLDHPNLIKLNGFCYEDPRDLLLVYEFASNGTLAHHLYGAKDGFLPWAVRLNMALEVALALEYLHFSVNPPIFHRDVKSTNILVDENYHVKLADFGLSRLIPIAATHVSTAPQGTPGYLDPEYHQSYQLTDKSDVYSFGVVLMELISGKPPVDLTRSRQDINLSNLAANKIRSGALTELADERLGIDGNPGIRQMVATVADLGLLCLSASKEDRPSMKDVANQIRKIKDLLINTISDDNQISLDKAPLINHDNNNPNPNHTNNNNIIKSISVQSPSGAPLMNHPISSNRVVCVVSGLVN